MTAARKHHYLSQCYLKGFAAPGPKEQVHAIDLSRGKTFATGTGNIAAIRDFNRIEIPGVPADQLENDYAKFEDAVAPVLRSVADCIALPGGDGFELIVQLMALLGLRNPKFRAVQTNAIKQMVDLVAGVLFEREESYAAHVLHMREIGRIGERETWPGFTALKEAWESGAVVAEPNQTWLIQMEVSLFPMLIDLLGRRRWITAIAAVDTPGFITCDHPVALTFSDPAMRGGFYSPGFALPETEVVFPVTQRLALIGAFEADTAEIVADRELQAIVNGAMLANASAQVYAATLDFEYRLKTDVPLRSGHDLLGDTEFLGARTPGKAASSKNNEPE